MITSLHRQRLQAPRWAGSPYLERGKSLAAKVCICKVQKLRILPNNLPARRTGQVPHALKAMANCFLKLWHCRYERFLAAARTAIERSSI